jgi:hypothetical protein
LQRDFRYTSFKDRPYGPKGWRVNSFASNLKRSGPQARNMRGDPPAEDGIVQT